VRHGGKTMSEVIECPECGKRLRAPSGSAGKSARCPGCGGKVSLGTTAPPTQAASRPAAQERAVAAQRDPEPDADEAKRPVVLWLGVSLLIVLGLVAAPLAVASSLGVELAQDYWLPSLGFIGIALMVPIGLGLLVAAIGLAFRKPWSRMLAIVSLVCGVVYYARLMLPVLTALNWDHPDAGEVLRAVLIFEGAPLLLFLVTIGVLFAPPIRRALEDSRPRARRRTR